MKNVNPVLKRKIHIFGLIISSKKGKPTNLRNTFNLKLIKCLLLSENIIYSQPRFLQIEVSPVTVAHLNGKTLSIYNNLE
ncbi:hypothetical protein AQ1689_120047 [Tenacibaculum maritimum]|nr:hypothetical protein AQ1688_100074 [Tenacibaculum maritimum]CAA0143983.1 hypothetical protein AQ1685_110075 [Tenacibaculum maritimum]CAA0144522.1 hypothetical protein AQ1689_120047 [Tenacibaculum maritimum]CAA0157209.1 hypothetical protein CVI1001048_100047 [Tenacibaculum maritimum]CAA0203844.1 hypothetical protein JIP4600_250041 [Tenacibaculum maritimum]